MKHSLLKAAICLFILSFLIGCARKSGCPSNGKNVGAERILNSIYGNEKIPKAKKFKA